jgi:hypothetical protein
MSKCKRCEEAEQARRNESSWLSVCEAEKDGLSEAYRHILDDNRALWDDWVKALLQARKLERKVAKLKERLAKVADKEQ